MLDPVPLARRTRRNPLDVRTVLVAVEFTYGIGMTAMDCVTTAGASSTVVDEDRAAGTVVSGTALATVVAAGPLSTALAFAEGVAAAGAGGV
jgi:hypothetical protein